MSINLTQEINDELKTFIKQANAIISGDLDGLFESGFLDIEDYKDNEGNLYDDYEDSAYSDYSEILLQKSGRIMTAYEVDNENNFLNNENTIAKFDNFNKSFVVVTLRDEHMYGDVVLSSTGDVFIQAFDKEYNPIHHKAITNVDSDHELMLLANHLSGGEGTFKDVTPDRNVDEFAHYYKIAEAYFTDDESLKDFRFDMLNQISGQEMRYPVNATTVTNNLKSSLNEYNSILVFDNADEKDKSFIYEIDGNIFLHESIKGRFGNESKFELVSEGDYFTFKGEEYTAEPNILKVIAMDVYSDFNIKTNYVEKEDPEIELSIEEEEPEPEVKRKNKFKP